MANTVSERNQCDGCARKLALDMNGNHTSDQGLPVMACTAHLYGYDTAPVVWSHTEIGAYADIGSKARALLGGKVHMTAPASIAAAVRALEEAEKSLLTIAAGRVCDLEDPDDVRQYAASRARAAREALAALAAQEQEVDAADTDIETLKEDNAQWAERFDCLFAAHAKAEKQRDEAVRLLREAYEPSLIHCYDGGVGGYDKWWDATRDFLAALKDGEGSNG